jgi:hypothetical protein
MDLDIHIANIAVRITFLGQAKRGAPLCQEYFRGFLRPSEIVDAKIKVSILKNINGFSLMGRKRGDSFFEKQLISREVFAWLAGLPDFQEDIPESETTITSSCFDGLLLFDPVTTAGHIYLLNDGPECFRPLHRLLWMYLAQVLGEKESCFIHCAALVKDERGFLFLGDSGAGKTALARMSEDSVVLSDDSPILSKRNGAYKIFASPYHQMDVTSKLNEKIMGMVAKAEGIFFLAKDNRLYLGEISREEAVSKIIKRYILFFPYLSSRAKSALFDLILELCHRLPIHNLHFCLDQNVWRLITGLHTGGKHDE